MACGQKWYNIKHKGIVQPLIMPYGLKEYQKIYWLLYLLCLCPILISSAILSLEFAYMAVWIYALWLYLQKYYVKF